MGHEYVGVVEEIGSAVETVKPGDFVVGSFVISDGTCDICRAGYPSRCVHAEFVHGTIGTQSERARIPYADGTLVATPGHAGRRPGPQPAGRLRRPRHRLVRRRRRRGRPGKTVAVVGDGAVGLLGILAARELGAERIIAMSRHADRQALAREFGATDIVDERGDEGVARIKELTDGLGAHSVIEAVGTQESMMQAIRSTRPGGHVGYVGVSHDVQLPGDELFFSQVHLHGGPAPVRRFLPDLIDRIWNRQINPGKVFDLELPLAEAAAGYTAMDERRAIKVLLRPVTAPPLRSAVAMAATVLTVAVAHRLRPDHRPRAACTPPAERHEQRSQPDHVDPCPPHPATPDARDRPRRPTCRSRSGSAASGSPPPSTTPPQGATCSPSCRRPSR